MTNNYTLIQTIFLALSFLFVFLFFAYFFLAFLGSKCKKKTVTVVFVLFVLGLSIMAYLFVPDETYDLYRHFLYMEEIQKSGYSLGDLFKQAFSRNQEVGRYPTLITFNLLRDVLVQTSNNHLLPFVCTGISYSIFAYISLNWFNKNNLSYKKIILATFVMFSLLPIIMIVSGIRNGTSFSLVALAIYKWLYQKKNIILFIFLSLIAIFMHTSAIIPVLLAIISRFLKGLKGIVIIVVAFLLLTAIMNIAVNSNIPLVKEVAERFIYFNDDYKYSGEMVSYICCLITCVICFVSFLLNANLKSLTTFDNFILMYLLVLILSVFLNSTAFMTRLCYLIAYFSPIIVFPYATKKKNHLKQSGLCVLFETSLFLVSAVSVFYYIIPFLAALY